MIHSLTHWLRRNGKFGLVLTLDIARYLVMKPRNAASYEQYYTTAAALDAYEVLRQFVDATDELEGCLLVVLAPTEFLATNSLRGLEGYDALKNRIWDDVRDENLSNPFAPLVRLEA
jgi:hypothetical protein